MQLRRTENLKLEHGKKYVVCGCVLMYNKNFFRFENIDYFEKLPAIFEPSFLIYRDPIRGIMKIDFEYAIKEWQLGKIEIKEYV